MTSSGRCAYPTAGRPTGRVHYLRPILEHRELRPVVQSLLDVQLEQVVQLRDVVDIQYQCHTTRPPVSVLILSCKISEGIVGSPGRRVPFGRHWRDLTGEGQI